MEGHSITYDILLVRNKSQVSLASKRRELHKSMNIIRREALGFTLRSVYHMGW